MMKSNFIINISVDNQVYLIVSIALGLLMIFALFKLIVLIKKIKKQKNEMQKLIKDYEEFLHKRDEV